jgi:hypothetical protein
MSSTDSAPTPPPTAEQRATQLATFKRNSALAFFVLGPTLALLPPRKLDFYTFSLAGVWLVSANHLTYTYTGRSAWQRIAYSSPPTSATPGKQEAQTRYEEVQRQLRAQGIKGADKVKDENADGKERGALEKVWMGGEKEDWREKRAREEREALERGEGYASLIAKHFREAFGVQEKDDKEMGRGAAKENEPNQEKGKR